MLMKWLTKKDIMELTGISRRDLDSAIKSGKLKYQIFNKRLKFTERDVELWQSDTMSHTDYSNAVKSTTHISRSYPKPESEYSFEKLQEEIQSKGLSAIA